MARRSKGNYKTFHNQASSITILTDGIKITATKTKYYQVENYNNNQSYGRLQMLNITTLFPKIFVGVY